MCEKEERERGNVRTHPGGFYLKNYMKQAWRRWEEYSRRAAAWAGLHLQTKCKMKIWGHLFKKKKKSPIEVLKYKAFPLFSVVFSIFSQYFSLAV